MIDEQNQQNEENQQIDQSEQLSKQERKRLKKEHKQDARETEERKRKGKKMLKRLLWVVIIAGALVGFIFIISNQKISPGTSSQGHIEVSPESHILTEPMDIRVQKHMLEHADGSGAPGIIINYNCEQFSCSSDFINNLAKFVEEYPENVYVAPYRNMSAKLILTAEGRQEMLDDFDEQRIRDFIDF